MFTGIRRLSFLKNSVTVLLLLASGITAIHAQTTDSKTTKKKTVIQNLCWSPDGSTVYFSAMRVNADYSDYSSDLWTVYRFDTKSRTSDKLASSAVFCSISPDNDQLAFSKYTDRGRQLYLLDLNTRKSQLLNTGNGKASGPDWSPDGRQLIFYKSDSSGTEIFHTDLQIDKLTQLTHGKGHKAYNPAWSPDGKHIVYYLEKGDGMDQIHVMNSDGTQDRNITNDRFNNIFPGWIDSETIIYGQAEKDHPTKAMQINIDGSEKKQVLDVQSFYARYSPDGSKLAFIDKSDQIIKILSVQSQSMIKIPISD